MHCNMVNSDQGGRGRTARSKMHKSIGRARVECHPGGEGVVHTQIGGPRPQHPRETEHKALIPVTFVTNSRASQGW